VLSLEIDRPLRFVGARDLALYFCPPLTRQARQLDFKKLKGAVYNLPDISHSAGVNIDNDLRRASITAMTEWAFAETNRPCAELLGLSDCRCSPYKLHVLLSFGDIVQQKEIIVAVGKFLPVMRIVVESRDFGRSVRQTPHIDVGGEGVIGRRIASFGFISHC
jgi:hypothetical protein